MIRWILATCVFLAVFGCSADEASSKMSSQFVGRWTAQYSIKDQGAFRYVIDRKPDGGYELQTVRVDGDKVLERESESGKWFVQAGSYKVKTEKVEGKAASVRNVANYQTYAVNDVQSDSIKLTHSLSGFQLLEKRVAPDYKLP